MVIRRIRPILLIFVTGEGGGEGARHSPRPMPALGMLPERKQDPQTGVGLPGTVRSRGNGGAGGEEAVGWRGGGGGGYSCHV